MTTLHRKLRIKEIATAAIMINAVVRDSKFVRKHVRKMQKHFDVCSLHTPIKLCQWLFTDRLICRSHHRKGKNEATEKFECVNIARRFPPCLHNNIVEVNIIEDKEIVKSPWG